MIVGSRRHRRDGAEDHGRMVRIMKKDAETVREWLDYGALRGLFQWRNSGKGRFEWEEVAKED